MLEQHDQKAIGKQLRAVYGYAHDPMLPDQLNDLVSQLLELDSGTAPPVERVGETAQLGLDERQPNWPPAQPVMLRL